MLTGRETMFSVEQAISRARSDESDLETALQSAMDEAARLRREEAEGFRVLARLRLDAMMRDQVIGGLDATEQRAVAIIERHRAEMDGLAGRRDKAQGALAQAEVDKDECDSKLAAALDALDRQRQSTSERIKTDPAWLAARAAVDAARKIAANAEQKASLAEADLATKGKPYEDDQLFIYLWTKKHGQPDDTSGPLVRFFDRKVARLVGYHEARANYAMLKEIPLRLREHAKNKQSDIDAALAHVVAIERRALVSDGIEPLEAKVTEGHAAMKSAEEAVAAITAQLQEIETARRQALAAGDDTIYDRATGLLAETFAREDLRQLYQDAIRTATKADDQAISAISAARKALQKADGEVSQIRGEIRAMASRRSELEGARDRARHVGYQDPRGTFGGGQDVIGQVIGGILGGALQGVALDRVLRDNYRFPVPRADPDFGGREASWPNPWSGGSADQGGSRDRGGSDDGGGSGWRTGGSF
jgi:chromosome segregation ATPase